MLNDRKLKRHDDDAMTGRGSQRMILFGIAMLLPLCAGCGTKPDLETSRRFQLAEEAFAAADSRDDFVRAASLYQEVLDKGFQSGSVFYNMGNAWMQAGQTGRAIAAYRMAERSLPRDQYLQANLNQALRHAGVQSAAGRSVLDYVFFWQNSVSYAEKAWLVTTLLATVLVLGLVAQFGWRSREIKRLNIVAAVVLLLAVISMARDWSKFQLTRHGVVIAETTARKGGSDTFDAAFNQSLKDGTEFTVLSAQNDWLQINVGGTGEGWVPARDCVMW